MGDRQNRRRVHREEKGQVEQFAGRRRLVVEETLAEGNDDPSESSGWLDRVDLAGSQEQQRAAPHPIVAEVMHHLSAPLQKHQLEKIVIMRLEPAWIVD